MDRLYTSTELTAWENNELAIENAINVLKSRLDEAPKGVLTDVLNRCNPDTHDTLIDWISDRVPAEGRNRVPRDWSPKRNKGLWILYQAADLKCPPKPPTH